MSLEQEVELLRRILQNQVQSGPRDWVLLNAATLLYAAGEGTSMASCLPIARRALEDGAAARKLDELVQEPATGGRKI